MNVKELAEKIIDGVRQNYERDADYTLVSVEAMLTEAYEAFLEEQLNKAGHWIKTEDYRELLNKAVAQEREACAKVAEEFSHDPDISSQDAIRHSVARNIAAQIRRRGEAK